MYPSVINILQAAFTFENDESVKKADNLTVFFGQFGFVACKSVA